MLVAELPGVGEPLRLAERPVPEPGPGEALVRIQACGVCGSDVFLQDGGFGPTVRMPVVPGHEPAGVVEAVGPDVAEVAPGDQVAVGDARALVAERLRDPAADPATAARDERHPA